MLTYGIGSAHVTPYSINRPGGVNTNSISGIHYFRNMLADEIQNIPFNGQNGINGVRYPSVTGPESLFKLKGSENGNIGALELVAYLLSSGMSRTSSMMLMRVGVALSNLTEQNNIPAMDYSSAGTKRIQTRGKGYSNKAIPYEAWKAVNPFITSDTRNRSPSLYRQVIDQFSVETNPRYRVNKNGRNETYCNIFMWDVTRAMGAEIPHYVDPKTNAPMYYPDVKGARQLTANRIYDWLHEYGAYYGWHKVGPEQAQYLANQGRPVVTALRNNNGGHGHVQVVCPSKDGRYDADRGVTIAQAGRNLTSYRPITKIYRKSLPKVSYFAHI